MLWLYVHNFVYFLLLPGVFSFDCAFSFLSLVTCHSAQCFAIFASDFLRFFFAVLFVCLFFLPYSHPLFGFSHNTSVSGRKQKKKTAVKVARRTAGLVSFQTNSHPTGILTKRRITTSPFTSLLQFVLLVVDLLWQQSVCSVLAAVFSLLAILDTFES